MKKQCFNKNWQFTFEENMDAFSYFGLPKYSEATGAPARHYKFSNWQRIDLPHDWAISLPKDIRANTFAGARANTHYHRFMTETHSKIDKVYNIGWYRKEFLFDTDWEDKRIFIEFEGVFRDAILWVNGVYIDRYSSGYTGFTVEITDHLVQNDINSLALRVDSDQPEGWFYEGSGIYRNVNIIVGEEVYFKPHKTFIKATIDGKVSAFATLVNDTEKEFSQNVIWSVTDKNGKSVEAITDVLIPPYSEKEIFATLTVEEPFLWDTDNPNLYKLCIKALDEETEIFAFRSILFDSEKGFFINGKPLKIHGACVHQDFGGVGNALTDNLNYYKIRKLKEMGCNAYRTAHHPHSPSLLKACDELGMLVMNETRCFGTSPEAIRQLTNLIERDRNHPSVFIWCIGNEEVSVQDIEWGNRLAAKMTRIIKTLDDTRPVTYSGNNGPNFIGINGVSEIRGINYIRNGDPGWIDEYHKNHPDQPIIGTEESSCVSSRGGTNNDIGSGQIDTTGDVTMKWGSTPKGWVKFFENRDYLSGGFMWTGFDYHGEPNPFENGNVSTNFGAIDISGIEKPIFYYYKAWWTNEPVLKIAPHWNFKKGEIAHISVYTNCSEVTLFLNGKSLGTKTVERFDTPVWNVTFEPGTISAVGKKDGKEYFDEINTADKMYDIICIPILIGESADDISIIEINAVDKKGTVCPFASDEIELLLADGKIVGVCNGDSACFDYEQKPLEEEARFLRVFNSDYGMFTVPLMIENQSIRRFDNHLYIEPKIKKFEDDFRIVVSNKATLTSPKNYTYTTTVCDVNGFEYIEFERFAGNVTVYLNDIEIGTNKKSSRGDFNTNRPYRFYCDFKEGDNKIKVIVETDESPSKAFSGYVKVGKVKKTPWIVRLYCGKARIFAKTADVNSLKAKKL